MKPRLHVLHVLNTMGNGGAETYVVRLANDLAARGLGVTVAFGGPVTPLCEKLGSGTHILQLPFRVTGGSWLQHAQNVARVVPTLRAFMRTNDVDLVHTHLVGSGAPAWLAGKLAGVPVVHTTMHVHAIASRFERLLYQRGVARRLVTRFHALSGYLGNELCREYPVPQRQISVVRAGVSTQQFCPQPKSAARVRHGLPVDAPIVGLCARLEPEKDVALAIVAAAKVTSPANLHLVIAGDGPLRQQLQSLAHDVGIGSRTLFLGHQTDVASLLPAFDAYLQTTRGPNLGFAALEAFSCGVPVMIAYRSGLEQEMASDTLHGSEGGLAVAAEPDRMADALSDVLNDAERCDHMSRAARHLAESTYDWTTHVSRIEALYRELAGSRSVSPGA